MLNDMVICPYCCNEAELVTGAKVYPHRPDLADKLFYYCDNRHPPAYVGCHPGTTKPLGRLADKMLRKAKNQAHMAFDWIWKDGHMERKAAYAWLALKLDIPAKDCHIGMMDVKTCNRTVDICMDFLEEKQRAKAQASS